MKLVQIRARLTLEQHRALKREAKARAKRGDRGGMSALVREAVHSKIARERWGEET